MRVRSHKPPRCWQLPGRRSFWPEAVRAVQAMAHDYLPGLPLISFVNSENAASIRLALAVGATLERETEFRGGWWHVYRHPSKLGG